MDRIYRAVSGRDDDKGGSRRNRRSSSSSGSHHRSRSWRSNSRRVDSEDDLSDYSDVESLSDYDSQDSHGSGGSSEEGSSSKKKERRSRSAKGDSPAAKHSNISRRGKKRLREMEVWMQNFQVGDCFFSLSCGASTAHVSALTYSVPTLCRELKNGLPLWKKRWRPRSRNCNPLAGS